MRSRPGSSTAARKILSYYRVNFDINPPYKVLADSETLHYALEHNLYLKQKLPDILCNSSAHLTITACTLSTMRKKGEDYKSASLFAKRLERIPCVHSEKAGEQQNIDEIECLKKLVKPKTLIITRNIQLIKFCKSLPGVVLLIVDSQKRILLTDVSKASTAFIQDSNNKKTNPAAILNPSDRVLVDQIKNEQRSLKKRKRDELIQQTNGRPVKRKKPKGPNPLSMKKSKKATTLSNNGSSTKNGSINNASTNDACTNNTNNDNANNDHVTSEDNNGNKEEKKKKRRRRRSKAKTQTKDDDGEATPINLQQEMNEKSEETENNEISSAVSNQNQDVEAFAFDIKNLSQKPMEIESAPSPEKESRSGDNLMPKEEVDKSTPNEDHVMSEQVSTPSVTEQTQQQKSDTALSNSEENTHNRKENVPIQGTAPLLKSQKREGDKDNDEHGDKHENECKVLDEEATEDTVVVKKKKQRRNRRRPGKSKKT